MQWLIATDLDGTLLDDEYPLAAAAAAIDALFRLPLVLSGAVELHLVVATSKTFAEGVALLDHCASTPWLVFENGVGLARRMSTHSNGERDRAPLARKQVGEAGGATGQGAGDAHHRGDYDIECEGMRYQQIREHLLKLRGVAEFQFRGFGDMTPAQVSAHTGLNVEAALLAQQRMASEPLTWLGTPTALRAFRRRIAALGLNLELGGRFHQVTGGRNKAGAVAAVAERLQHRRHSGGPASRLRTNPAGEPERVSLADKRVGEIARLACGDAPNDVEMMCAADFALVFPGRNGNYILPRQNRVFHAPQAGPAAWSRCVVQIIESHSLATEPA